MAVESKSQLAARFATAQTVEQVDMTTLIDSLAHVTEAGVITRKSEDQSFTATALADVTDLSFSAAADTDYFVEANLIVATAASTTGVHLSINGPASPNAVVGHVTTVNTSGSPVSSAISAYDGGSATANAPATDFFARCMFIISNGANAGAVSLRCATEVSMSAVTIKEGSFIRVTKLN